MLLSITLEGDYATEVYVDANGRITTVRYFIGIEG